MHQITGKVECFPTWMVAWIDNDLIKYYRALLPKAWYVMPPMYKAHISIVRLFEEPDRTEWDKFNGRTVNIQYEAGVQTDEDKIYFWLNCVSDDILQIRRELKLPDYVGNYEQFHITVGNCKPFGWKRKESETS